jgi:hypothetical protein
MEGILKCVPYVDFQSLPRWYRLIYLPLSTAIANRNTKATSNVG